MRRHVVGLNSRTMSVCSGRTEEAQWRAAGANFTANSNPLMNNHAGDICISVLPQFTPAARVFPPCEQRAYACRRLDANLGPD